jgi:hypothetical protein
VTVTEDSRTRGSRLVSFRGRRVRQELGRIAVGLSLLRVSAAGGVAAGCLTLGTGIALAVSPTTTKCPSASLVGSALAVHVGAPTSTTTTYAKICTYKATGSIVPLKIQFQKDTPASFAAGENAVPKSVRAKVTGLGKAAYGTKVGGFLAVFLGTESIRITAPGASLVRLEKLARKLL